MIDNFFQDNYHSYDKVYQHPETNWNIYLGDMQAALDDDFLRNKNIKTGILKIIQSLQQPKTWIISSSIALSNIQYTHFLTANYKASLPSSTLSIKSQKKASKQVAFWSTALLASREYFQSQLEFNFGHFLYHEKVKKDF